MDNEPSFSIDDIEIIELEDRLELDIGRCNGSCDEAASTTAPASA